MGPTPESAGITAQPRLRYLRVASPIELVFFLDESLIGGRTRKPDSSEIHPTPRRGRYLPTEQV